MKVLVIGNGHFAPIIARNLSTMDENTSFVALNPNARWLDKFLFLVHLLNADVVYAIGGTVTPGGSLQVALWAGKRIVMHWIGSDVTTAVKAVRENRACRALVERARHLCEVDWIKSELAALGVSANVAQIACFSDEQRARVIRWPAQFSVLTYIGKGRERFYGFDKIINMAQEFPSIPFRVAGISDWPGPIPPNLHLLGWVKNMEEEYEKCVLFLRLTEHDGLAFSVLEAFSYGRYVAYSHNFPPAEHTPCLDTLRRSIRELSVRFDQDNLGPNHEAQAIILREFAKTKVMSDLRKELFLA